MTTLRRVLIVHTFGLGDWIMLSPTLKRLTDHNPEIQIDVCSGEPSQRELIEAYPNVRVVSQFSRKTPMRFLVSLLRLLPGSYDLCLFPSGFHSYHADFAVPFLRTKESACLKDKGHKPRFLSFTPPMDRNKHRVLNNLDLLQCVDLGVGDIPDPFLPYTITTGTQPSDKTILFHTGSSQRLAFKRWPIERFVKVATELESAGWRVHWIFGPEDLEMQAEVEAANTLQHQQVHTGLNFQDIIKLTSTMTACLTSDSGIGHIAAALGKTTYTIMGPANPAYTSPWGDKSILIEPKAQLDCRPCIEPGGKYGCVARPCLDEIKASHVVDTIVANQPA